MKETRDLCREQAERVISQLGLTQASWTNVDEEWRFLESSPEQRDLHDALVDMVGNSMSALGSREVVDYLQSTTYNPFRVGFNYRDLAESWENSTMDHLRVILIATILYVVGDLLKPADFS